MRGGEAPFSWILFFFFLVFSPRSLRLLTPAGSGNGNKDYYILQPSVRTPGRKILNIKLNTLASQEEEVYIGRVVSTPAAAWRPDGCLRAGPPRLQVSPGSLSAAAGGSAVKIIVLPPGDKSEGGALSERLSSAPLCLVPIAATHPPNAAFHLLLSPFSLTLAAPFSLPLPFPTLPLLSLLLPFPSYPSPSPPYFPHSLTTLPLTPSLFLPITHDSVSYGPSLLFLYLSNLKIY